MATHSILPLPPSLSLRRSTPPTHHRHLPVTCGPRDNRGPLIRGRTLSTEAILAIQALKRAHRTNPSNTDHTSLSRLIKPDLLAALAELQRQNHWRLALAVFSIARREPWYKTDYALYAEMAAALSRGGAVEEIDVLVSELVEEQQAPSVGDVRGVARLVKVLIAAGKGAAVRDVYGMMKRGGWVADEFLFRVLIRGLKRLGEEEAAGEVERDYEIWLDGGVETPATSDRRNVQPETLPV